MDWAWVGSHLDDIQHLLLQHITFTVSALFFGFIIAFPLALVAARYPGLYQPILGITGVLFTIPSIALFLLLLPFTGLSETTCILGLTIYTLLVLVRNTVEGLRGVPDDVKEAAEAMGYRPLALLMKVELPIALPVVIAGLRIAAVTTIGLVTITALITFGGLGAFFIDGFRRDFATPIIVGIVLSVALAVAADLSLVGVQRVLTPWARTRR